MSSVMANMEEEELWGMTSRDVGRGPMSRFEANSGRFAENENFARKGRARSSQIPKPGDEVDRHRSDVGIRTSSNRF
jgi:hypothetical protein